MYPRSLWWQTYILLALDIVLLLKPYQNFLCILQMLTNGPRYYYNIIQANKQKLTEYVAVTLSTEMLLRHLCAQTAFSDTEKSKMVGKCHLLFGILFHPDLSYQI